MINEEKLSRSATPAKHFAFPPYKAECFNHISGWSGVMNVNGINCLTFTDKPGAVITSLEMALDIAERWNKEVGNGQTL